MLTTSLTVPPNRMSYAATDKARNPRLWYCAKLLGNLTPLPLSPAHVALPLPPPPHLNGDACIKQAAVGRPID